ncbi:MAG: hypothetical protein KGY70_20290 [Bacteroidales bacterium]|nr:hypothetical protein [Bacteroidales bacterium]MBS3777544.1 hypothetical protein [Bacteroidales bacterium]
MTTKSHTTNKNIKQKILILQELGADHILENSLNKIIEFQLAKYKQFREEVKAELQKFENTYNIKSEIFFDKFQKGEMGDKADYIEWASIYENLEYYNDKIATLEGVVKK